MEADKDSGIMYILQIYKENREHDVSKDCFLLVVASRIIKMYWVPGQSNITGSEIEDVFLMSKNAHLPISVAYKKMLSKMLTIADDRIWARTTSGYITKLI